MTIHARLIHSDELGADHRGLVIHGQHLTGDWSEINPTKDVLAKLRGNRHVELDGDVPPAATATKAPAKPRAKPAARKR